MPKLNVKEVMGREAKAQARKDEWRSIYEDCYEFALPQRNLYGGYYEGKTPGKNKGRTPGQGGCAVAGLRQARGPVQGRPEATPFQEPKTLA